MDIIAFIQKGGLCVMQVGKSDIVVGDNRAEKERDDA
jgi:hypothetical protein